MGHGSSIMGNACGNGRRVSFRIVSQYYFCSAGNPGLSIAPPLDKCGFLCMTRVLQKPKECPSGWLAAMGSIFALIRIYAFLRNSIHRSSILGVRRLGTVLQRSISESGSVWHFRWSYIFRSRSLHSLGGQDVRDHSGPRTSHYPARIGALCIPKRDRTPRTCRPYSPSDYWVDWCRCAPCRCYVGKASDSPTCSEPGISGPGRGTSCRSGTMEHVFFYALCRLNITSGDCRHCTSLWRLR